MIYTGIGARSTPPEILKAMTSMGRFMAEWGHTLRSGGAQGADQAFEEGCKEREGKMEIYLPFKRFRGNESPLFGSCRESRMIAKEFHPAWNVLGPTARDFMGRNTYQILGLSLDKPTNVVVCWTSNGGDKGGTSQAIRMARHYGIPVINLGSTSLEESEKKLMEILIP